MRNTNEFEALRSALLAHIGEATPEKLRELARKLIEEILFTVISEAKEAETDVTAIIEGIEDAVDEAIELFYPNTDFEGETTESEVPNIVSYTILVDSINRLIEEQDMPFDSIVK